VTKGYILADDLSGALEVGASFRQAGRSVSVPLGRSVPSQDLEVISTETRNASPRDAASIVSRHLLSRKAAGSTLLFKKIDSTLRGPLSAEVIAVCESLSPPLIVFCPANPAARRIVRDGELLVHGVRLNETEFRNDPAWPATTSSVATLLKNVPLPQAHLPHALLRDEKAVGRFLTHHAARGPHLVIADAETDQDLDRLAAAIRSHCPAAVPIGANGLGAALARLDALPAAPSVSLPKGNSLLVVCGSRHPASHRQIDQLAARRSIPIVTVSTDTFSASATVHALAESLKVTRAAVMRFATDTAPPSEILRAVGETLRALGPQPGITCFLTGGETAWTACQAFGGDRLEILGALENACVLSVLRGTGADATLVTKPGGYGDPDLLHRIVSLMEQQPFIPVA